MKIKVLWMYHDLMDLYGDKGNIQVIKTRCAKRNIDCVVDTCTIGEVRDISQYDLFFFGGGADREQNLIFEDLLKRKDDIQRSLDKGCTFLLICGGYQMFGQYYKDQDGKQMPCLGFFPYYTESSDRDHRCIGNIVIQAQLDGNEFEVVGFENHGGQTRGVTTPLGKVLYGHGNEHQSQFEGFANEQVIATYMHGPLLPKNPAVADTVILRALKKNYGNVTLEPLDDVLENKAREVMLDRLLPKKK